MVGRQWSRLGVRVLFLGLCLSASACSSDPVGHTVAVSGKVTRNGQPITTGSVVYWPDANKGNTSPFEAAARITPEGTYELVTRGKPGAPPGVYKVTVTAQEPSNPKDVYSRPKSLVPPEYLTKEHTPLSIEVRDHAEAGAYDLDVK